MQKIIKSLTYKKADHIIEQDITGFHLFMRNFVKRAFDIFTSLFGLLVLLPFFLVVALLIHLQGPGPIFFRGPRMGRGGKLFGILKFRTMYERPESYHGPLVTAKDDQRITPLGRWLRNTKLNELPQLWNVLVGDMSLVGPRPEDPVIVALWPEDARNEILSVRPGITSPASISYHDEEKLLSQDNLMGDYLGKIAPDKLRLDRLYVRHHTFITDLDAIFWTLIVLVPRIPSRPQREGWLFGGPFTRVSHSYLNWAIIDFFTALIGAGMVGIVWRTFAPLHVGWDKAPLVALYLAVEFGLVNSILGLGRVEWSRAVAEDAFGLFFSSGIVAVISILVDMYLPIINLPDGYILIVSVVTLLGFIVHRYRFRLLTGLATRWVNFRNQGYGVGERVLIVGAGAGGEMASWLLRRPDFQRLFHVIGYVDDAPFKQGMRYDGHRVLGATADIPTLVKEQDIGVIFYTINKISASDRKRILLSCSKPGIRLVLLSDVLKSIENHIVLGV